METSKKWKSLLKNKPNSKSLKLGSLLVFAAAFLWGSMGLFVRNLNEAGLSAMEIVFIRNFGSAVVLMVIVLIVNPRLVRVRAKDFWCFLGTGILSMVFFNFCYFSTIASTSLSVAAILLYTSPIFVMILARILFKEKLTKLKILALILAVLGCFFVTGVWKESSSLGLAAIIVGLGAGLGYALYTIFGRYALNKGYHSLTISLYTFLFAAVGCAPLTDFEKIGRVAEHGVTPYLLLLGLIVFVTILPYVFYTAGLKQIESGRASIVATIEPVAATMWGFVHFGENPGVPALVGAVLVLSAAILISIGQKANSVGQSE